MVDAQRETQELGFGVDGSVHIHSLGDTLGIES